MRILLWHQCHMLWKSCRVWSNFMSYEFFIKLKLCTDLGPFTIFIIQLLVTHYSILNTHRSFLMIVYTVYGIKAILLLLKRIIRDLEHNLNLLSNPCHNSFEPWIVVPLVLIFGGTCFSIYNVILQTSIKLLSNIEVAFYQIYKTLR